MLACSFLRTQQLESSGLVLEGPSQGPLFLWVLAGRDGKGPLSRPIVLWVIISFILFGWVLLMVYPAPCIVGLGCLDFPGLTLRLPTLRQQPCHWIVASYRLCLLYPVCFSCHQIRVCDGLQGAGPCCLAVSYYSLFWHSLRWSIWAIWRCNCSSCNGCGGTRSRCGTWNLRAVGQVSKTHMVL